VSNAVNLLGTYLRDQKPRVAALAVLLLGGIALQLVGPLLLRAFIDGAVAGDGMRGLQLLAGLFIAASIVSQVASVAAAYFSEQVGWTATNLLRADLLRHCLRLDMPFHNARSPGEMIERVDGDITALANFFSQFVIRILGGLLLLIGVLVLLWVEEPRVGAVVTLFALISLLLMSRTASLAVPRVTKEREAFAQYYGLIEERLAGVDDIRANGGGGYVMRRLLVSAQRVLHAARRARLLMSLVWTTATALYIGMYVLVLGLGVYLHQAGEISVGTVFLFFQYTQILRRPMEQIADELKEFQRAGAAVTRVRELLMIQPQVVSGSTAAVPTGALSVEFDGVSFAYRAQEQVLNELSFALTPGTKLGVLGRTGCGKTTLARLLVRLYDPTDGTVRIGGVDVRGAEIEALRGRVGIVTQEVQLFRASLRDNLTLFDPTISDDRVITALEDLGLAEWVRSQPDGLETVLGSGGAGLSAGEAQLLAFTRVFLRDPATERLIDAAVDRLLAGRTAIVIAHHLGTIERVDEVMILDGGRIAEHGPRSLLAADQDSIYAGLLRTSSAELGR
jgi:ABC-type multidrug transport system fused ATPase/permease subunit